LNDKGFVGTQFYDIGGMDSELILLPGGSQPGRLPAHDIINARRILDCHLAGSQGSSIPYEDLMVSYEPDSDEMYRVPSWTPTTWNPNNERLFSKELIIY
jgi:hypothetical protein